MNGYDKLGGGHHGPDHIAPMNPVGPAPKSSGTEGFGDPQPSRIDPPNCGCTDCLTGYSRPAKPGEKEGNISSAEVVTEYAVELSNLITGERRIDNVFSMRRLEDAEWLMSTVAPERKPVVVSRTITTTEWTEVTR